MAGVDNPTDVQPRPRALGAALLVALVLLCRKSPPAGGHLVERSEAPAGWAGSDELRRLDAIAGVLFQTAIATFVGGVAIVVTLGGHVAARVLIGIGAMGALSSSVSCFISFAARPTGSGLGEALRATRRQVAVGLLLLMAGLAVGTIGGGAAFLLE